VAVRPSYGHCRPPSGADAGPHKLDCLFSSLMPRIIIGIAFAQVPRRIFSSAALRHRIARSVPPADIAHHRHHDQMADILR